MTWLFLLVLAILATPAYFFGEQAVRLLRETWDGVLKADPKTGDIRPTGATLLAQELFAMLDDSIPQTQNAPVTMNAQPNTTPLTINNPIGGNAISLDGGTLDIQGGGGFNMTGGQFQMTQGGFQITDGDINVAGGMYLQNGVPIGGGSGGGTTSILGKVVSGTGATYVLDLYGNGSTNAPTSSGVTATVPQIDHGETIPAGTWVGPVCQLPLKDDRGNFLYQFQPAVWLS